MTEVRTQFPTSIIQYFTKLTKLTGHGASINAYKNGPSTHAYKKYMTSEKLLCIYFV
jgi:hypothetical protein